MPPRSSNAPVQLTLPLLRPDQGRIISNQAQFKVIANGRRWGKTYMCVATAVAAANAGASVAWMVPTYKNARPAWRFVEKVVRPAGNLIRMNRAEHIVEFPSTGWLGIYSADNDVAMRGEAFDVVIGEEAAQWPEETYTDVVQPTLADRRGRCILISTPKGRNWFWREWVAAKSDTTGEYAAFTAPTSDNPLPNIQRAFEQARTRVPWNTFRQEWLAEFVEDGGTVFRSVDACIRKGHDCEKEACPHDKPCKEKFPSDVYPGSFGFGLDWGKDNDYTDVTVLDLQDGREVDHQRFNQVGWDLQCAFVEGIVKHRWKCVVGLAELNSIGSPNLENLQRRKIPVHGQYMTNQSKSQLVEELVLALEQKRLSLGEKPENEELRAYQQERLPSGMIRYSAPSRVHDDYCVSLMLANHCVLENPIPFELQLYK